MTALMGLQCHLCKASFPAEAIYVCGKLAETGGMITAPKWRNMIASNQTRDQLLASASKTAKIALIAGAAGMVVGIALGVISSFMGPSQAEIEAETAAAASAASAAVAAAAASAAPTDMPSAEPTDAPAASGVAAVPGKKSFTTPAKATATSTASAAATAKPATTTAAVATTAKPATTATSTKKPLVVKPKK